MSDERHKDEMEAPGVFVLSLVFLGIFIVIWWAHYKWLAEVWGVQ
jgi:hypothetical protein